MPSLQERKEEILVETPRATSPLKPAAEQPRLQRQQGRQRSQLKDRHLLLKPQHQPPLKPQHQQRPWHPLASPAFQWRSLKLRWIAS